jgi:mannose-6-phosphate isomerase-like protein (cupin superfamily)
MFLLPDEGRTVSALGSSVTVKVSGQDTNAAWCLTEFALPARFIETAPPPHIHTREDEAFYVLEGSVTFQLGSRTVKGGPGSLALSPRGELHRFWNPDDCPARMLTMASPAGLDDFFLKLYALLGREGPPDLPAVLALFGEYGMKVPSPPANGDQDPGSRVLTDRTSHAH